MAKPGQVYISVAAADLAHGESLASLLRSWKVRFTFDLNAARHDSPQIESERAMLAAASTLLRVCTPAARQSARWQAEAVAFAEGGVSPGRKIIDVVLDPAYSRTAHEPAADTIQAAGLSPTTWHMALRRTVQELKPTRDIDRRTLTIIIACVVVGTILLAIYGAWQYIHHRTLWDSPAPDTDPNLWVPFLVAGLFLRFA